MGAYGHPIKVWPASRMHIVQRVVGCKLMAIAWGRYHQAADRFVDADPASQGVEEECMPDLVKDWRVELIRDYADLFHPPLPGDPTTAEGWPCVGDGWADLLQRACARIQAAVQADGDAFKFTQVKEKYGTLRAYWEGALSPEADAMVEEAIDLAEARSASTCEICGKVGLLYGPGWLTTRCAAHADGRRPVEIRPGFENIHIEERFVRDRRVVWCRRYDRETDSFLDVDPGSVGIQEW